MNKNWLVFLLAVTLIIEYKNGYKKAIVVDSYIGGRVTTVLKIGHNRKYIDMRRVKKIYEIPIPLTVR